MKVIVNLFFVVLAITNFSCSDIFEEDLENRTVIILAPADGVPSSSYAQTFWWEPVDGALQYNLQVVSPSFNAVSDIVLDTTVTSTKFTYSFDPGTYEWRVRAENGSSATQYFNRTMIIDTTSLSSQTVLLSAPATGYSTKSTVVTLNWQSLFNATQYELEIDTIGGNFTNPSKLDALTTQTSYTFDFRNPGKFEWRVKALNATEESGFSIARTIEIDQTPPSTVSLTGPGSGSQNRPVNLQWNASSASDFFCYKVYVYTVATDTTILDGYPKTWYSNTFPFSDGTSQQYVIWRVKVLDKAGNESAYSSYRNFTIGF